MHSDQLSYRRLYDEMLSYDGDAMYDDLLRPWLEASDGERRWLDALRARRGRPVPEVSQEESWRLYALSRIVDLLQLSFAPPVESRDWNVAPIGRDEHAAFMAGLGLEPIDRTGFHPFHHEIVTVDEEADEDAIPKLVRIHWPGYTLGSLLITRAGVRVAAGRRHLRKEIAERSTLYWAHARNHRPTEDLGRGWGGNSQWRTAFRRDYLLDGVMHYNAGAPARSGGGGDELGEAERIELLRHRCFVTCTGRSDDRWPYDLTGTEPA